MEFSRAAPDALLVDPLAAVTVRAPGRLHLGFLDPAGSLGRRFGSLGLVVNGFETELELSASQGEPVIARGRAERAELARAAEYLTLLQRHSGCQAPLQLKLLRVLPAHAGFGSGTQLALAIGRAFAQWHRLDVSTATLAQWLGRGVRSGIGVAGFDQGGLLVDGGPGADGTPAPLLARLALPAAWRLVVVTDATCVGLSGAAERRAIAALAPLPRAAAADLCHQVLMQVLPGAAGDDFAAFAAGINRIQQVLGDHFAPAQDGARFTSAAVARALQWIAQASQAAAAIGQSSWGPTGFAILPSQAAAEALVAAARAAGAIDDTVLALRIVSARNHGATVACTAPSTSTA